MGIGIILVMKVGSIDFCMEVTVNFYEGLRDS
jgi:hypothetical protein